jgi:hypothetical protein
MKNKKKLHISRVGKRITFFVRLMPSRLQLKSVILQTPLKDLDFYGFVLTVSLAIKTGSTFMGVNHYRLVIKPFKNAVSARLDTHLAARATVEVDLDPNSHPTQLICFSITGGHTTFQEAFMSLMA